MIIQLMDQAAFFKRSALIMECSYLVRLAVLVNS